MLLSSCTLSQEKCVSDKFATFHKLPEIFIAQINKSIKCIMKHKQSCYFELYSFQKGYWPHSHFTMM